jgi:hypothetical protein
MNWKFEKSSLYDCSLSYREFIQKLMNRYKNWRTLTFGLTKIFYETFQFFANYVPTVHRRWIWRSALDSWLKTGPRNICLNVKFENYWNWWFSEKSVKLAKNEKATFLKVFKFDVQTYVSRPVFNQESNADLQIHVRWTVNWDVIGKKPEFFIENLGYAYMRGIEKVINRSAQRAILVSPVLIPGRSWHVGGMRVRMFSIFHSPKTDGIFSKWRIINFFLSR